MFQDALTIKAGVDPRRMARSGICFMLILALLFVIVVPVHAIALTTGIAIATVGALVLAACGVVITAPTGQRLTDYIGGQIDSYAVSQGYSNRSTWLNGVTQQTVTSTSIWSILDNAVKIPGGIYNALTTWAGSYIEDNGVVSGGDPVGELGSGVSAKFIHNSNFYGSFSGEGVASNNISITYTDAYATIVNYVQGTANIVIPFDNIDGQYTITVLSEDNTGSYNFGIIPFFSSDDTSLYAPGTGNTLWNAGDSVTITKESGKNFLRFGSRVSTSSSYKSTGTMIVEISGNNDFYTPGGTVVTPTASVIEPLNAAMGQDVIISGLPVTSSMTPEAAADAIQDKATTSDGLTATSSLDGDAVPEGSEWLYDQLDGMPNSIGQSIADLFVPSDGFWSQYVYSIQGVFDQRMGLLTYPISVIADLIERIVDLDDVEPVIRWNDISWRGQVVIPGGSYNFNDLLEDESIETMYNIYRVVVSGLLIIAFLHLCRRKLEEIETK